MILALYRRRQPRRFCGSRRRISVRGSGDGCVRRQGSVVEQCSSGRRAGGLFLGGHPMAGKGGQRLFDAAEAGLFQGASYIVTPLPDTPPAAVETVRRMAEDVGCTRVTVTTPEHHDALIAFHLPTAPRAGGAYVRSPVCPEHKGYSAGSYRMSPGSRRWMRGCGVSCSFSTGTTSAGRSTPSSGTCVPAGRWRPGPPAPPGVLRRAGNASNGWTAAGEGPRKADDG